MLSSSLNAKKANSMNLEYVTERIIVALFSDVITDVQYRAGLKELTSVLRKNYTDRYKILNVSKKCSELSRLHPVEEFGWPEELAPPLDWLCTVCKVIETWLGTSSNNVIVLHCKGGHSRAAIVVAAYMHYITICGHGETSPDCYAMQQFCDNYISTEEGQPSHIRYVKYFAALLSGKTKINSSTVYLNQILLSNLSGKNILFKIYEGMQPTQSTQITHTQNQTTIDLFGLPLRGDILVKCFERTKTSERSPLFRCQFNTCTFDLDACQDSLFTLKFTKQQLDDIYKDNIVDNRATIEFQFLTDAPVDNNGNTNKNRKLVNSWSRADSYENFDKDDEEIGETALIRSQISPTEGHQAAESTDSGIASDPQNTEKKLLAGMSAKARTVTSGSSNDCEDMKRSEQVASRAHSALPATVRPVSSARSPSPMDVSTASGIDPDLVAKDRYDPASKCFSYVPARALNEHFTTPRKPLQWIRVEEPREKILDVAPSASEIASVSVAPTELVRRADTPKWDDEIDKVTEEYNRRYGGKSEIYRSKSSVSNVDSKLNGPSRTETPIDLNSEIEEKPIVCDQAKRATKRRKTKYDSYKTLNDETCNSDMDDLCDPEFYLNCGIRKLTSRSDDVSDTSVGGASTPAAAAVSRNSSVFGGGVSPGFRGGTLGRSTPTTRAQFARETALTNGGLSTPSFGTPARRTLANLKANGGFRSSELPRKAYTPVLENFYNSSFDSSLSLSKPATSFSDYNDREAFRYRNCRSAASVPIYSERMSRFSDRNRYDSVTDAENADDWLRMQLNKLKDRREKNPDTLRRKRQEKLLLEELKSASSSRQLNRDGTDRSATIDGSSQSNGGDPLTEYRLEEQRLQMTNSPYPETRERTDFSRPRRIIPAKSADIVLHKPPTPPPRAVSRSPPGSPYLRRSSLRTPTVEMTYQNERRNNMYRNDEFGQNDNGDYRMGWVTYQLQPQAAKSILKKRDTYNNSPSPMSNRRTTSSSSYQNDLSFSSLNRSATPAFPVRKETPLPYHPLLASNNSINNNGEDFSYSLTYRAASPRSLYYAQSGRSSVASVESSEVVHHHPVFVKDTSKYWYKPTISREEAINILRDKPPGTFLVRDSNSFPGAFGLALKVATPPPGVHPGDGTELVRHFLIEPSPKGVKLKGCSNEPIFGTLSALVYQHSITPLALPTKLILPEYDPAAVPERISAAQVLLQQGAACNVTYITSIDCESLTGSEAVKRCIGEALELFNARMVEPVSVHFKVSARGVTITDNTRQLFFRRHYPVDSVIYAGIDPLDRKWDNTKVETGMADYVKIARTFAFIARKAGSYADNACHVFAELEQEQPASAVVSFITKVMMGRKL